MYNRSIEGAVRTVVSVALVLCMSSLFGCATITRGAKTVEDISVDSDPQGAAVMTNSGHRGVTPCVLALESDRMHVLEISKKEYKTTYVTVKRSVTDSSAGNFIAGGIMGTGIDSVSGAGYTLVPNKVKVKLVAE